MLSLILKRLGIGVITVLAVSVIIFFGTKILPGDAAQVRLGQEATEAKHRRFARTIGTGQTLCRTILELAAKFHTRGFGIVAVRRHANLLTYRHPL